MNRQPPSLARRLIALALGCAICAVLYAIFYAADRSADPGLILVATDVDAARDELADVRASRDVEGFDPDAPWLTWRYHIPESSAEKLLPQLADTRCRYDPWCGFVYKPYQVIRRKFREHPAGEFEKRFNRLGIMPDREVRENKPRLRVLITGDSHVEGICSTSEGYPMLLETALEQTYGTGEVEVLNAARGGYAFLQYLGVLERFIWLELEPDLFVVTVFAGNDLAESQLLSNIYSQQARNPEPVGDWVDQQARRKRAKRGLAMAYGQCLSTASYLHVYPGEFDFLLRVACRATLELQKRCREKGIELLVVVLPSPSDLPQQANWDLIKRSLEHAALDQHDLDRVTQLRVGYTHWLQASGVAYVDLYEAFSQHEGLLYWKSDLHLNLDGHALAARTIEPHVVSLMPR